MIAILENPELLRQAVPLTVEAYGCLTEEGLIARNTELLYGVIFKKPGKSPLHSGLVRTFLRAVQAVLDNQHFVSPEQPLRFRDSCPEPDLAVIRGQEMDYMLRHPETAALVIEVCLSSEVVDREKALIYADAGVEEYWLVLPEKKQIERFSHPAAEGYLGNAVIPAEAVCSSLIFPALEVRLADWLV